jgi:hypothetical protein
MTDFGPNVPPISGPALDERLNPVPAGLPCRFGSKNLDPDAGVPASVYPHPEREFVVGKLRYEGGVSAERPVISRLQAAPRPLA